MQKNSEEWTTYNMCCFPLIGQFFILILKPKEDEPPQINKIIVFAFHILFDN